MVQERFVLL